MMSENKINDLGFDVHFEFSIGQRVAVEPLGTEVIGYIDSAAVNQTGGKIYVVVTGQDDSRWYAEQFLIAVN